MAVISALATCIPLQVHHNETWLKQKEGCTCVGLGPLGQTQQCLVDPVLIILGCTLITTLINQVKVDTIMNTKKGVVIMKVQPPIHVTISNQILYIYRKKLRLWPT